MRLEGIQKCHAYPTSTFLHTLEAIRILDYNEVLNIEEDFWKIRSHINWLSNGDANTISFHLSIGRRNKISFVRMNLTIGF